MVKCEVCGRKFHHISNSHMEKHGMTLQQYKEQYPHAELVEVRRVKCRICGKQLKKIGNGHLRTHDMTLAEYYVEYPQDAPAQYRNRLSHREDELVTCLVCGTKVKTINATHLKKHGMTTRAYMEKFPGAEMQSRIVRRRHSEVGKEICETSILTPEAKAKAAETTSQRSLLMWESDRDALIEKQNHGKSTSETYREAHRERQIRWMNTPEGKAAASRGGATCVRENKMVLGHHSVPTVYDGVQYRSMTEAKMAELLDNLGITFEYEKHVIGLSVDGYTRSHTPDFYLPEVNIYLEVKGRMTDKAKAFHAAATSQGFNYVVCTTTLIRRIAPSIIKSLAATPGNRGREKGVDCWKPLRACAATAWPETASANARKAHRIGQSAGKPRQLAGELQRLNSPLLAIG